MARDAMVRLEEKINYAKAESQQAVEETAPLADELQRIEKELEKTRKLEAQQAGLAKAAGADLEARKGELDRIRDLISKSDSGAMQINREMAQLKVDHEKAQLALHEAKLEADRIAERAKAADRAIEDTQSQLEVASKDLDETLWALKDLKQVSGGSGKKRADLEKRLFDLRKGQAELAKQHEGLDNRIRRLHR